MLVDRGGRVAMVPDARRQVARYVRSGSFAAELRATRSLWGAPGVEGGAGLFVFATYATLPVLTAVGADERGGALMVRSAANLEHERRALAQATDLTDQDGWRGGLGNPVVVAMLTELGARHRHLPGMRQEYLDLFAGLLAVSAVRVAASLGRAPADGQVQQYWSYMTHAMALLGARLDGPETVTAACARFVAEHSGVGPESGLYLTELVRLHRRHVPAAQRASFPATAEILATIDGR